MAPGRLFYGSTTFEVDDADITSEALAAALDGNATSVDIDTTVGSLRVFLGMGAGVAVLTLDQPSAF
ncbi:MAG: hypothetical protein ACRDV3_03875 [Acidothermaceae bacterium]